MKLLRIFAAVALLVVGMPSADAGPSDGLTWWCVHPDFTDSPGQTYVGYDMDECVPFSAVGDGRGDAGPILDETEKKALVVGATIIGGWGFCLVADPGASGFVWADIEHDCDETPCDILRAITGPASVQDVCDDPCSVAAPHADPGKLCEIDPLVPLDQPPAVLDPRAPQEEHQP